MKYEMTSAAWALAYPLQDAIMMIDHNAERWQLTAEQQVKLAQIIAKFEEVTGVKHKTLAQWREEQRRKEGVEL